MEALRGRRPLSVDYWDIHNVGQEPARWDYGDWHHAVMGVQLTTDVGPVTVTWTNTFHPYGVEEFHEPIELHLVLGDDGPPNASDQTAKDAGCPFLATRIRSTAIAWERLEIGSARLADGTIFEPAKSVDVPTALRLDFDAGAVWFVAAIPQPPNMNRVFLPGDEIMVVFAREKMRDIGFEDLKFLA